MWTFQGIEGHCRPLDGLYPPAAQRAGAERRRLEPALGGVLRALLGAGAAGADRGAQRVQGGDAGLDAFAAGQGAFSFRISLAVGLEKRGVEQSARGLMVTLAEIGVDMLGFQHLTPLNCRGLDLLGL